MPSPPEGAAETADAADAPNATDARQEKAMTDAEFAKLPAAERGIVLDRLLAVANSVQSDDLYFEMLDPILDLLIIDGELNRREWRALCDSV